MKRRVVVTGLGAITPIGSGSRGLYDGLRRGRSGIRRITRFDTDSFSTKIAGEVPDFDAAAYLDAKRLKRLDRYSQFAIASARMAFDDARLDIREEDRDLIGCYIGSALDGAAFAEEQMKVFAADGIRRIKPALALSVFAGAASCNIAIEYDLRGPASANSDSCASGTIAIGEAFRLIRDGYADVILAGGVEAPLSPLAFGAFTVIRAMSTRNDDPEAACRPFDRGRDGFVMAEGAAVLVLEAWDRARRRGAPVYGEILGHGVTNDAHHMTAPLPSAVQAARAMQCALAEAGLAPGAVGYINAHASSTPLNDAAETLAIKRVFGESAYRIPISGTKAMHGHALGASGAIEAAICMLAFQHAYLPPTLNLRDPDPECDLDYMPDRGRELAVDYILSNSFGFGGINTALVFGRPPRESIP